MSVTITVGAHDAVGTKATTTVTATVAAVPVVTAVNFTVPTNPTGTFGSISATNSPTSFQIVTGNTGGYFAIGQHNTKVVGAITPPDGVYPLTVNATNAAGTGAAVPVNITVGKAITLIPATFTPQLPVTAGQVIGTLGHTGGTPTAWTILSGDPGGFYAVSKAGVLSFTTAGVAGAKAVSYSLTLQATNAFGSVSGMWKVSPLSVPSLPSAVLFQGNINAFISSIDISGGIAAPRTSGQTPFFIQVDASLINASGTAAGSRPMIPFEDPFFQWNFGDPTGSETLVDPTTGLTVNLNTSQTGPAAGYCYRTAGTYHIALTITAWTGTGFISTSVQQTITVSAYVAAADFFVDFSAGAGGSGTIGSPFNSISQVNTAIASAVSNTRFNFKRGTSTTVSSGIQVTGSSLSGMRFGAYGTGAVPIIATNGNSDTLGDSAFSVDNGGGATGHPVDDTVVSNINFQTATGWGSTGTNGCNIINIQVSNPPSSLVTNLYFDNCSMISAIDPSNTGGASLLDASGINLRQCGVYMCTITGPVLAVPANELRQGIGGGWEEWAMFIGNTVIGSGGGGGGGGLFDHHMYIHIEYHGLWSYNTFGATATGANTPTRDYSIKVAYDGSSNDGIGDLGFFGKWFCLNRNYMSGTQRGDNFANGNNDPTQTRMINCVVQQNSYAKLNQGNIVQPNTAGTGTWRDNNAWGIAGVWFDPNPINGSVTSFLNAAIYRNKIYTTDTGAVFGYLGGTTWSTPQQITDNIVEGTNTAPNLNDVVFSNQVSAGSFIDRNNYYAPNASGNYLFNNTTGVSLATWQGTWDKHVNPVTNSNSANPNWANPANGQF